MLLYHIVLKNKQSISQTCQNKTLDIFILEANGDFKFL